MSKGALLPNLNIVLDGAGRVSSFAEPVGAAGPAGEGVEQARLRSLVGSAVEVVERHFIGAALDAAKGNRTAAARMLGLSRQSLYVKLSRYGLILADD